MGWFYILYKYAVQHFRFNYKLVVKMYLVGILLLLVFNMEFVWCIKVDQFTNLKKNYFGIKITKNYPYAYCEKNFHDSGLGLMLDLKHYIKTTWIVEFAMGYKNIYSIIEESNLALFVLEQSSYYILNINYPFYFFVGGSLLYIYPVNRQEILPVKRDGYKKEIGVSVKGALVYVHTPTFLSMITLERWRGINRRLFQAVELNITISIGFN